MRGQDYQHGSMWSYLQPEQRVPDNHPLRPIREMANRALKGLYPRFNEIYSIVGRSSIPPEQLLRAILLQVLYTVRSERMLMEQMNYNLLFRWFVGLNMDDPIWDVTVFTKNRKRFLDGEIADAFFEEVLTQAREANLLSDEHFTVDGTLIEAWASQKSFRPKDGSGGAAVGDLGEGGRNPSLDFRGEKRSNETHASITDPDARLARKSKNAGAILAYGGHVLMENRNGLVIDAVVTHATGKSEWEAATTMIDELGGNQRITVGGDKKYDDAAFIAGLRSMNVTPHIAQNLNASGGSVLDGRTTRHAGYAVSQRIRKRIEEIFGWEKTVGTIRKTKLRGLGRVGWMFKFNAAAYNLVRMANLLAPHPI
jgi:transposase